MKLIVEIISDSAGTRTITTVVGQALNEEENVIHKCLHGGVNRALDVAAEFLNSQGKKAERRGRVADVLAKIVPIDIPAKPAKENKNP